MSDSVYFGDIMRTLHEILKELKSMNKKLDKMSTTHVWYKKTPKIAWKKNAKTEKRTSKKD